ncbi:hypothetical protein VTO42DRAFT_6257 [Malbranchea cinnamomea]
MPDPDAILSSPPTKSTSPEDAIAYYKAQYEQLEAELAEFQASSRELEAELEKDIEASEKRERKLKEKVESLKYEVEEWKTKYKQAKQEANTAQNTLQKEITTLRENNRALQLKLRDIEVANDDFERQARHTTSSLEDLESKYNVAIERGVLLEEEIRTGEQERETLRIENQRLRDELSDLKVETHIIQEKLRKAEALLESMHRRKITLSDSGVSTQQSLNHGEHSPTTTTSSPMVSTPPAKSVSSMTSDMVTPPSPPFSEASTAASRTDVTPSVYRAKPSVSESKGPTKASQPSHASRHARNPSLSTSNGRTTPLLTSRRNTGGTAFPPGLPKSGSLYQIRGLIGKMQRLEQRVQSARSRLPAPFETPPRASPRSGSVLDENPIPSTVTVRSTRKRSVASSRDGDSTSYTFSNSRTSFGTSQRTPSRPGADDSRPSSRTSLSSHYSVSQSSSSIPQARSESRLSGASARVPGGGYSSHSVVDHHRPRSSLSNYNPSSTMSYIAEYGESFTTPTPRRTVLNKGDSSTSGIPTPVGMQKRQSAGSSIPTPRRTGSRLDRRDGDMPPPARNRPVVDLGETY